MSVKWNKTVKDHPIATRLVGMAQFVSVCTQSLQPQTDWQHPTLLLVAAAPQLKPEHLGGER